MKNKLDCEVVEDLLPSYIDRLTHEKTTQLVQEHLENCISCQKKYETMSLSDEHSSIKEIDYLKKIKKQNKRSFIKGFLSLFIVISLVLGYIGFIRGWQIDGSTLEGIGNGYTINKDDTQTYWYQGKLSDNLAFKQFKINDHDIVLYGGIKLINHADEKSDASYFTMNLPVTDKLQYYYLYDELIVILDNGKDEIAHKIYTPAQACLVHKNYPSEMFSYLVTFLGLETENRLELHEYDGQQQLLIYLNAMYDQEVCDFIAQTFFMFGNNMKELVFIDQLENRKICTRENYQEDYMQYNQDYESYLKFYDLYFN